ncbi:hypothetical protein [uncultured Microbacterium sp.]|uniref:hypothetical protein n=1 Tax=uncultured Microbacterium sp. TaxID=191216 RepID=UPI0035CC1276
MADRRLRLRREASAFGVGSLLFMLGAVPLYATAVGPVIDSLTFFIGSIFFTLGGAIQLALSGRRVPRRDTNTPDRLDWWSAAVQSLGTLFFNVSTAAVLVTALNADPDAPSGWRPDAFGSIAFLVSGVFAVVATTERDRLWDPHARTWRCSWIGLAGCILFAVSAVGAYVMPLTGDPVSLFWANFGTFTGAACFLTAAILSRREVADAESAAEVSA